MLRVVGEFVRGRGADLDHIVAYVCKARGLIEQELSRPRMNRFGIPSPSDDWLARRPQREAPA
jgi:hypothetical protein